MPGFKDHSGMKFGKWTLLKRILGKRPAKYICQCDCGKQSEILISNLMTGYSTQCMICSSLQKSEHLIGKKFNHLEVLSIEKVKGKAKAKVLCDCGKIAYLCPHRIQKTEGKKLPIKYISCGKCKLALKKSNTTQPFSFYLKKGYSIGRLTIIKELDGLSSLALCECGNEKVVKKHHMTIPFPSCGCLLKEKHILNAKKIEGKTYFKLKVLKFIGMGQDKRARYLIKCKCGKEFEESISYLFGSKSCGCLQKENAPKGSKSYFSKLTELEVKGLRELYKTGLYSRLDISKMFPVRYETICNIIANKTWKHV